MVHTLRTTIRVSDGGRIVIPADVRERLGLSVGSEIVLAVEDDHATLMAAKAARHRAQQRVRKYVDPDVSLSEELMVERREDAKRE
jgi:AbrB family looped-hinge helix DNA binding protein